MKCPRCSAEMENKRGPTNQILWHFYCCSKCGYDEGE